MQLWGLPLALFLVITVPTGSARSGTVVCVSASSSYISGQAEALLRRRFSDVHLETAPYSLHGKSRCLHVLNADTQEVRALIVRGRIALKFLPHGPEYPSAEPFKSATIWSDNFGNPVLTFTTKNPHEYYEFTRRNVGKTLAILVDGHRVTTAYIQAPISQGGEIAMERNVKHLGVIAALMDSGPLPKDATVSLEKPASSRN